MANEITRKILKEHDDILKTTKNLNKLFNKDDSQNKYIELATYVNILYKELPTHFEYEERMLAYLFKCYLKIIGGRIEKKGLFGNSKEEAEEEKQKEDLGEFFTQKATTIFQIMKEHGQLLNATEYLVKLCNSPVKNESKMYGIKQKYAQDLVKTLEAHAETEYKVLIPLIEKNKTIKNQVLDFYLNQND